MKLNDFQSRLVEETMWLPESMARKYSYKYYDDMCQEGMLGLCYAALKYDPDTGVKFDTYAYYYVERFMKRYISKSYTYQNSLSDEDDVLKVEKIIDEKVNVEEEVMLKDDIAALSRALYELNEKQRDVITRYYGLNGGKEETLGEIAQDYGVSTQAIHKIKTAALKKLRDYMKEEGRI